MDTGKLERAFRADAAELLGSDHARLLADRTRTLAELLVESGWRPGGFSCRTQLTEGRTGREGVHLAQLLAELTE